MIFNEFPFGVLSILERFFSCSVMCSGCSQEVLKVLSNFSCCKFVIKYKLQYASRDWSRGDVKVIPFPFVTRDGMSQVDRRLIGSLPVIAFKYTFTVPLTSLEIVDSA